MGIKKISFKNMVKVSNYYALGGVRLYDLEGVLIPIKFATKKQTLTNKLKIEGTDITGVVNTKNSYGTYYFVENPFDTDNKQIGNHTTFCYWVSETADEISITFDKELEGISKIEYVPKPDTSTRSISSLTIEVTDKDNLVLLSEVINTSSAALDEILTLFTPTLNFGSKILISSNSKVYSFKDLNTKNLIMSSNNAPSPYVASASGVYSTAYPAYKAFDGDIKSSGAWITPNGTRQGWVQLDFGSLEEVNKMTVWPRQASVDAVEASPKKFAIYGSLDGVNYDELGLYIAVWSDANPKSFDFKRYGSYRYYKFEILEGTEGKYNYTAIGQIEFAYEENSIVELEDSNVGNFEKYGARNPIKNIDSNFNCKHYVLQGDKSINKLRTNKLNRKPLSIKFN